MERQLTKSETERKNSLRRKYVIYGIGAGALLGGGYLLYNYLQDRQAVKNGGQPITVNNILPNIPAPRTNPSRSGFPLKRGSKGSLVQQLQLALLKRGGQAASIIRATSIRPDGSADGGFGPGTERALRAAGLATVISEKLFNQITSSSPSANNSKQIASELIGAANSKNIFASMAALRKMNSVADYKAVKSHMAEARIGGVRVTSPVNALLSVAFRSNEPAKVKIRAEFSRMGLKQNSRGIWTLSGFEGFGLVLSNSAESDRQVLDLVVTDKTTLLKNEAGDFLLPAIKPNTLIGYLTDYSDGVAQVLTENGMIVYAPSKNLKTM